MGRCELTHGCVARDQASKQASSAASQHEGESESSKATRLRTAGTLQCITVHTPPGPTQRGYCSSSAALDSTTQRSTLEYATRQAAVASPAAALPLLSTSHLTPTTTPLRPITPIHTRALSTRDLFLRLFDHCNAHCPPATRLHDIFQLSELYSWIALHQLQPALDTLLYRTALG